MGFRRLNYDFRNIVGTQWRSNKRLFCWLFIFAGIGLIISLITIFTSSLTAAKINNSIIDRNVLNMVKPNIGIGALIGGRLIEFLIPLLFVFIICLNSWTALLCFPYIALRGYAFVINIYWIIARYGIFSGLVLLLVYLVLLLVLLIIFITAIVFMLRQCAMIRRYGFKCGVRWSEFFKCILVFVLVILAIAFIEWLFYWLVLGKMVFV